MMDSAEMINSYDFPRTKGDAALWLAQIYAKHLALCENALSCQHSAPADCLDGPGGVCPLCKRYYELKREDEILKIEWTMILEQFPELRVEAISIL